MRRTIAVLALALTLTAAIPGGLERGNRLFRDGRFAEAVEAYRSALEDGTDSPVLQYNLGTALLRLGRYAEAEQHLKAALKVVDPERREWVYYNLGQRFLEEARQGADPQAARQLYDGAVEAYRHALRLAPDDAAAKWNYELALREREQQQSGGGGGGEDQQDENKDQQQQDQGPGSGQSQGSPQSSPSQGGEADQAPLTKEQAERILSAVEQDERELFRDKLQKGRQQTRTARDW